MPDRSAVPRVNTKCRTKRPTRNSPSPIPDAGVLCDRPSCGQASEQSKLSDCSSDHGMLLVPRLPDSVGPLMGAVVVVSLIAHVEEVKDGQLSGTRVTTKSSRSSTTRPNTSVARFAGSPSSSSA
jgi:hypothetical protein